MRKIFLIFLLFAVVFWQNATGTSPADQYHIRQIISAFTALIFQFPFCDIFERDARPYNQDYNEVSSSYNYDSFSEDGENRYVLLSKLFRKGTRWVDLDRKALWKFWRVLAFASAWKNLSKGGRRAVRQCPRLRQQVGIKWLVSR